MGRIKRGLGAVVFWIVVIMGMGFVSAGVVFGDDFESGNLNNWILSTNNYTNITWNASQNESYNGAWHAQSQPFDNHVSASNMEVNVSTQGFENISVSYYRRLIGLDGSDYWRVKWFDGASWILLESNNGGGINDLNYTLRNFNLPNGENNSNFRVRFECSVQSSNEYCRIDDFLISGDSIFQEMDYQGYLNYLPDRTYHFYINQSNRKIKFVGVNLSNQQDYFTIDFDENRRFVKRINNVWFNGWFDSQNLYLNQYVGLGIIYSLNANQTSQGVYNASFNLNNVPYLNASSFVKIGFDTNKNNSVFDPVNYPGAISKVKIDEDFRIGGHAYGPVLFETKLVQGAPGLNISMINVGLWVKEDLSVNQNPRWVSPLITV
ncbi:MAG: hypothetical protein Q8P57_00270 [Candidatus Pacearchaeota archaeon]|nr:hypothetical protein [Candidatus Pacearchaeota archaeon]